MQSRPRPTVPLLVLLFCGGCAGTDFMTADPAPARVTQTQWIAGMKNTGCIGCNQLGQASTRTIPPALGTFANGVEAWLKPTDFENDQILFSLNASGGTSLATPADYAEASMSAGYVGIAGVGGLKALGIQKVLAGKPAAA